MKIFIAGATGTLGRPTVRALAKLDHQIVAMTRDKTRAAPIERDCAAIEVADAFDADAVASAMRKHRPDAVLHLLTDLPKSGAQRAKDVASTNRLRTDATRNLLRAAEAAGATRVVAESFFLAYGPGSFGPGPVAEDALPPAPTGKMGEVVRAARSLEEQVVAWGNAAGRAGVALRYGMFFGPGVPSYEALRAGVAKGKVPLIGDGSARVPIVALDDAVDAIVTALRAPTGVYNVADPRHPRLGDLLGELARAEGARPPRRVPYGLARLIAPFGARVMTTDLPMDTTKLRAFSVAPGAR